MSNICDTSIVTVA